MYYDLFQKLQTYISENPDKKMTVTREEVLEKQIGESGAEKKDHTFCGVSYRWGLRDCIFEEKLPR